MGGYLIYRLFNVGIAPNAKLQQFSRYGVASIFAVMPMVATQTSVCQTAVYISFFVAALWAITYPLTYHLTHRRSSPDYDNQLDVAFGIYLFGIIVGLNILLPKLSAVWTMVAVVFVVICLSQWIYYFTYSEVVDDNGIKALQDTHYNEIIEYFQSYSPIKVIATALASFALLGCFIYVGASNPIVVPECMWWQTAIAVAVVAFMTFYTFKKHHGVFGRTGIVSLWCEVKKYDQQNAAYITNREERLSGLQVEAKTQLSTPHTIMLVIGESASRDFMSAFTPMDEDTTPWLRTLSTDKEHCILFHNAYSCDIQTVPTLSKSLTETNQYDGGEFMTSCSIVDIAHKLGYRVHWYSNQGHLGASDTPITIVAGTADVAKWTKQELGKPQYDEALVDFLSELDPQQNNLLVLHLKGSHFNYENRFKEEMRQWGEKGSHDQVTNYKNTLYYTDTQLRRFYEEAKERLNLRAMVYMSDHADVPDRHRQPNFGGFRDIRIPLMVWLSEEYLSVRPERTAALHANADRYWTNDMLYELMCGLMDVSSNHFSEANSLASAEYKYKREDLTAINGQIRVCEDHGELR